ncbi:MAG TPA: hypothetical protein VEV13_07110 [Candidatus Limnocylindria bacterium]|nr:hypothetical protein [Candidatus Limnocylindria bacterium]
MRAGVRPSGIRSFVADLEDRPLGPVHEVSFEVHGVAAQILVVRGSPELLDDGRARAAELLDLWRGPASELLDPGEDRATYVSVETLLLADLARSAHEDEPSDLDRASRDPGPSRTFAGAGPSVELPGGARGLLATLDTALTADLVAHDLVDSGALGVCVRIGGDARMLGIPPRYAGWRVGVSGDPTGDEHVLVAEGGMATRGTGPSRTTARAPSAWQAALRAERASRTVPVIVG